MKILIVEDEPSLRELIQCSLEKERYVVETASDFNSALRKIEDYDYDCILLDIMLPDGSGLDLLERLKALHKRENVIIISAKDSLEDKVLGLELGADDYLPKPFHLVELNARIKSVIRRHQHDGEIDIRQGNVRIEPANTDCKSGLVVILSIIPAAEVLKNFIPSVEIMPFFRLSTLIRLPTSFSNVEIGRAHV